MPESGDVPFWVARSLDALSNEEWESLCDGCGRCCLVKLIDDLTDELHYTSIACRLFDCDTCRCRDYENREVLVKDCVVLSPRKVGDLHWMPSTCAYRLLHEGQPLPWWHPLVSGRPESVHEAGMSARGRVTSEQDVSDEMLLDHIVDWPA